MITLFIIGITVIFSIIAFGNQQFFNKHIFNPYVIYRTREWHRFFTHALIHADYMHLFFNMYVLYAFGEIVEDYYFQQIFQEKAPLYYGLLYLGGIMISSFPSFEKHKNNAYYSAVGASGAVSAIVFSSIVINPLGGIGIIFIPGISIPSFVFGIGYLWYSWYMAKKGTDNIGHDAHFWGAVFGIVFTIALKPMLAVNFFNQIF